MEIKEAIEELNEAIDMAISALEKQEAKKPRIERVDYDKYCEYCINYYCPCCNRRMVSKDKTGWFAGDNCRYCECGQRIDWSDVEQEG